MISFKSLDILDLETIDEQVVKTDQGQGILNLEEYGIKQEKIRCDQAGERKVRAYLSPRTQKRKP